MFVCISHRRQAAIMSFGASTVAESATGCDLKAGGCRADRGKSILPGHPLWSEDIQKQFGLRTLPESVKTLRGQTTSYSLRRAERVLRFGGSDLYCCCRFDCCRLCGAYELLLQLGFQIGNRQSSHIPLVCTLVCTLRSGGSGCAEPFPLSVSGSWE